jgi:DNA (cytosine-5)-methyltransferase 1
VKKYETINFCEYDKYISKAYSIIHNADIELNLGDITTVKEKEIGNFDMMTWGFPCQHISIAGKKDGFVDADGNKTSSGLYEDGIRILREKKPKISIVENVKNLTSKTFKNEFNTVLTDLDQAGYNVYWKVLSAADYDIPQTRERVFIIGIRKDIDNGLFKFPQAIKLTKCVQDLMEEGDLSYAYLTERQKQFILDMNEVQKDTKWSGRTNDGLLNPTIAKTLQTKGKARQRAHMNTFFVDGLPTNITVKEYKEKYLTTNPNIRYATSLERFRLMGFDDEDYYKLLSYGMSENQMNIFTGNSIVVDVLYCIFLELYKVLPEVFDDLKLSSFFSGIGAFEKALNRLYKYINDNTTYSV